jgi:ComF family protein
VSLASLLRPPIETLVDLVYPPHCAGCGVKQPAGRWLCEPCEASVRRLDGPKCQICSRPFDGDLDIFTCPNCRGEALHMDFAVAVMRSHGLVRDLIHRFKYAREFHLRRVLGDWLVEAFEDSRLAGMDEPRLVPVPLHPTRLRERQFNQSEALAEWVARRRGLRMEHPLRRRRHTITQTDFDRRQRMRNLRDAFALRQNADVKDKSFLLVDDVLTTGSTLDECARVLLEGGAHSVRAITVARG